MHLQKFTREVNISSRNSRFLIIRPLASDPKTLNVDWSACEHFCRKQTCWDSATGHFTSSTFTISVVAFLITLFALWCHWSRWELLWNFIINRRLFYFYLFAKIAPGVWSLQSRQLLSKARACGSAGRGCTSRRTLTTQTFQNPIPRIRRQPRGLSQIRWAHKSARLESVISAEFNDRHDCRWWP